MSEWMLRRGRRAPVGPVNTERLARAIRVGRVPPDTEACRVGSDDWRPYADFPEVQAALDRSSEDPGRASEVPLVLESERAGPNTERSAGVTASQVSGRRPSAGLPDQVS